MNNNSAALQEFLCLPLISSEVNLLMTFYYTDELISCCKCKMPLFFALFADCHGSQVSTKPASSSKPPGNQKSVLEEKR